MIGIVRDALLKAIVQGPILAIIVFPFAVVVFAAVVAIFIAIPLLLFVPFLVLIAAFLGSHLSWTFAARLSSNWAGLGAFAQQTPFMSGFWHALPLALVLHVTAAVLEWVSDLVMFEWYETADPQTFAQVTELLDTVISPVAWGIYVLLMAMILAPRVIGLDVRHPTAYGTGALLSRLLLVLPLVGAMTWLASYPLEQFILYAFELYKEQRSLVDPEFTILDFLKVPVFYAGVLIWLSSTTLLAFEAHFLARLETDHLAGHFAQEPEQTPVDYRAIRKEWSERDRD